jgi:prepilin-type N-terminal cleavage/methylation domain-containing protein
MRSQRGITMLELVTVLAVVSVLAPVAVPSAAKVRSVVSGAEAARRLALVLRTAQAQAQSSGAPVRVEVDAAGVFRVTRAGGVVVMTGGLGASIASTYPSGALEYSARGWAGLPGATSPRAGHFSIAGSARTVVVQLSGCVRCT